jgi:parallel beta-helix repeat protein
MPQMVAPTMLPPANTEEPPLTEPPGVPRPTLGFEPGETVVYTYPAPRTVGPLFSLRHDFGEGVGFRNGFTYLQGFMPIWQRPGRNVAFADVRLINFDDRNLWEWNIGGGYRWLSRCDSFVFGVNAYYDGNRTFHNNYHQLGIGAEVLGEFLEFRLNTYTILGRRQTYLGNTFANPVFVARNIALDRLDYYETALGGLDLEAGGRIPILRRFDPRAFVGYYHYSGSNTQSVNGIRLRGEAWLTDRVTAHVSLQNDARFDTTLYGGLAMHFGGPRQRFRGGVVDKLGSRVVRDVNIVMGQDTYKSKELALDPKTGDPIIVTHAASFAAPGGDGTVERPVQTLPEAQALSAPGQIVFAHAGSVFKDFGITLQPGQRFLGEGVQHLFTAKQGSFVLPRATSNTALPVIYGTPDCAVHLANDTEVAGFVMDSIGCDAIHGEFVNNVLIRDNIIRDTSGFGIFLADVAGNITIRNNTITGSGGAAIEVFMSTGHANLLIENNRLSGDSSDFPVIDIFGFGDSLVRGTIRNNVIDGMTSPGNIGITLLESARGDLLIENNQMFNGRRGVDAFLFDSAQLSAIIRNNSMTNQLEDAVSIDLNDSAFAAIQVARNTILDSGFSSIYAETFDTSTLRLQIFGNTVNRDMELYQNAPSVFNLEGTTPLATFLAGTNTFQAGAIPFLDAGVTAVPFGSTGFPAP